MLQSLLLFGGVLLAFLLAAAVLWYLRGRLHREQPDDGVLSLEDLRRLRDNGTLTIAEYERLRAKAIDSVMTDVGSESGPAAR